MGLSGMLVTVFLSLGASYMGVVKYVKTHQIVLLECYLILCILYLNKVDFRKAE